MNEAWKQHIQPILDSWQWDNFSWVWEPFLKKYPEFNAEQRTQVEDAILVSAFDLSDEKLAIKALAIAGNLHRMRLATGRFSELMKTELRKQLQTIPIDRPVSRDYVFAFSTFGIKESAPVIKSIIRSLEKARLTNSPSLSEENYRELFRACCLSLLLQGDAEAESFFAIWIENDLRASDQNQDGGRMRSSTDLVNFWKHIGISGFRKIVAVLQGWQKESLAVAIPVLRQAAERISFQSGRDKQEYINLIGKLEKQAAANVTFQ